MENYFTIQMYGYTLNPNSTRKELREDLIKNLGIKAINGEKGKKGELHIYPTSKWTQEKIISYLQPRHNGFFPGIGNFGFKLKEQV